LQRAFHLECNGYKQALLENLFGIDSQGYTLADILFENVLFCLP